MCGHPFLYVEKALDVLECEWILTDNLGEQALKKAGARQRIFNLDQIEAQAESQRLAVRKPLDCDPAFFLFTSGSTGVPKGVAISHRRVMDYISWAADFFDCDSQTVIGNQAPFLFTVSVMDLYLCFYAGARLCLIPEHTLATPTILVDFLKEKEDHVYFLGAICLCQCVEIRSPFRCFVAGFASGIICG